MSLYYRLYHIKLYFVFSNDFISIRYIRKTEHRQYTIEILIKHNTYSAVEFKLVNRKLKANS